MSPTNNAAKNANLHSAKKEKNDEFYTQLGDIENELKHYTPHFSGKTVYCNCDDPTVSGFVRYFFNNFRRLGLQRLIATCYKNQGIDLFTDNTAEQSCWFDYQPTMEKRANDEKPDLRSLRAKKFRKDGDFRSKECIDLLQEADIVCTNPPFSLFREYVAQLMEYNKKFIIIGNKNAITYKEIFPLIKEDKMWCGYTPMGVDMLFDVPEEVAQQFITNKKEGSSYRIINGVVKGRSQSIWFTNLDTAKRHVELTLYKTYNVEEYPKYDNYDAIEVSKVVEIPKDYDGAMGVPLTFFDKYNPNQFEIIGMSASAGYNREIVGLEKVSTIKDARPLINNKNTYARIFICKRQ